MWFGVRAGEQVRTARWCLATSSSRSWGNCHWDGSDSIHPMLCSCHRNRLQLMPGSLCLANLRSPLLETSSRRNRLLRPQSSTWMVNRRQRALNREIGHFYLQTRWMNYPRANRWGWLKLLCRKLMTIWGTIGEVPRDHFKGAWMRISLGMIRSCESRRLRRSKWVKSWVSRSLRNISTTWVCLSSLRIRIKLLKKLQMMSKSVIRTNVCL